MATTQKKTGSRSRGASSQGKRKPSTSSASSRPKSNAKNRRKKKKAPAPAPFRREVGAVICLLLAIFAVFGYFHIKAIFVDGFCSLVKGVVGYGYWLVPMALILSAYILGFHRGRPVRLRLTCCRSGSTSPVPLAAGRCWAGAT